MDFLKEDLPPPYDQIAEELGVDAALKLARIFSGERVYFPKYETVERPLRDRKIISEFNGYNFNALARRYNLTSAMIRQIVKSEVEKKRNEPINGQMSLLDDD